MSGWLSVRAGGSHRRKDPEYQGLLKRYDAYLRLLRANSDFLETLADIEALSAAPDLCGWERLKTAVTNLNVQVFAMAQMLKRMSGGRYDDLLPVLEDLGRRMDQVLSGHAKPAEGGPLLVPLAGCEKALPEPLLGGKAANLQAVSRERDVLLPEGVIVTTSGFREFLSAGGLGEMAEALWGTLDPEDLMHLADTSATLQEAALATKLSPSVEGPLVAEVVRIAAKSLGGARFAVRSSAGGEDSSFSFAGQYDTFLDVPAEEVPQAVVRVFAGFFKPAPVLLRLMRGFGALEIGMGALIMAMVRGRVSGVAYSRDPSASNPELARLEAVPGKGLALVGGQARPSSYLMNRSTLALLRESRPANPGAAVLLSDSDLRRIARLALTAEAVFGRPADVEWTLDEAGDLWLLQARPAACRPAPPTKGEPVPGYPLLLEGGEPVSAGCASGPVVHVGEGQDLPSLTAQAVLVAPAALPELALLLPRSRALVTERGATTSHLATVAREFGIPAVFGLTGAVGALARGQVVTVDGTSGRVYGGHVPVLVEAEQPSTRLAPSPGPVRDAIRDLLPLIVPLRLTDPASPEFTASGCRSLHDAVRFVHEKALAEVLRFAEGLGGATVGRALRIREGLPFDLRLLPLGTGAVGSPGEGAVEAGTVGSVPARALLEGLLDPAVSRRGPRVTDVAGFASVVATALGGAPDLGEPALALVSDRYLLMSCRIGYHFTTIEAFAGGRPSDDRIRFSFKGGAADEGRRRRRALFLAGVLRGLGFQVRQKGDFVSATLGDAEKDQIISALRQLGRLLVCAGQLDMSLSQDRMVGGCIQSFLDGNYTAILDGGLPTS